MSSSSKPVYNDSIAAFRAEDIAAHLSGDLEKGVNACVECCDRYAEPGRVALNWESADGRKANYTFEQLRDLSARFANYLTSRGIGPGDVVAGLLPRTPELLITILGTWRAGAIYQPLFTAFGSKAVEHRLQSSGAKLVATDPANRPKLDGVASPLTIAVVTRADQRQTLAAGDDDFYAVLDKMSPIFEPVLRHGDDGLMMMFTSGTTGLPKGVLVPIKALLNFWVYMVDAVDLRPEDKYWNIADPGWAYGLYYAVTGPLLLGHAITLYDGPFTVESAYRIIETHGITNLAGAPTAYRLLIAAGPEAGARVKGQLRCVSSAGEPLNPEVIRWFDAELAAPIHDHYGQTEMGMCINNHHGLEHDIHSGSAGLPMRGFCMMVIDSDGKECPPNVSGELAIDIARSPLFWFKGYQGLATTAISNGVYRTGDLVERGADGHISFVGRNDDVITSAGYRIGPFDVESALLEHKAVIETAVVGKPDPERTEIVKAFVVLQTGFEPSDELAEELRKYVRQRLSAHAYPREIEFVATLPKTPSGKLQRFILRNNEIALAAQKSNA